jgi:hypothetical protein
MKKLSAFIFSIIIYWGGQTAGFAQENFWLEVSNKNAQQLSAPKISISQYRTIQLDINRFRAVSAQTPLEKIHLAKQSNMIWQLPLPDGSWANFRVIETELLAPDFAQLLPHIKTYTAQGIDDPTATAKIDWTPQGFHAMILSPQGDVFIDPYQTDNQEDYIVYYKKDFDKTLKFGNQILAKCFTKSNQPDKIVKPKSGKSGTTLRPSGTQLRAYRIAVSATGEYTQFHGGTVATAQAAIITTINRVAGVYEREVAITFQLINNTGIVFTNAASDPFTNDDGRILLDENQRIIDNNIGSNNYDIGHVFSTGGGGIARLGSVCTNGIKAQGVTGLPQPVGDPYDIDYVAHEIGHQFGGNHTFNSVTGACEDNREESAAYEPGSGTTIMAYAGICGTNDIQSNSDAYFHTHSFDEIVNYSVVDRGRNCPVTTNTGNRPPVVTMPTGNFTIPINTPFVLTASATDPDNDALSYCWEQYDLGPQGSFNSPNGNAPIFRSFSPTTNPSRTFPRLSNLINNTISRGELLPSYSRVLTFRATVRDNQPVGGVDYGTITFNVSSQAGPFVVTSPNTNVNWQAGSPQTVTWSVANTNVAPVNCQLVNIRLSIDGGNTYPILIVANTPNDGSESVTVPANVTNQARIRVEGVNNIFFDISNVNFRISPTANTPPIGSNSAVTLPEDAFYTFKNTDFANNYFDNENEPLFSVRISDISLPSQEARLLFQGRSLTENEVINISNINQLVFNPLLNANGQNYASFSFEVNDGTFFSSVKYKMTINVSPVNDLPSITVNLPLRTFPQEVSRYTIDASLLAASDIEDPANALAFVIRGLPTRGRVFFGNQELRTGNSFTINDLTNNLLTYAPNTLNQNINDNIQLVVRDTQGGESSVAGFNININENFPFGKSQVIVKPNPTDGKFNIQASIPSTLRLEIELIDIMGKTLGITDLQKESGIFSYDLDLTGKPSGVYFLKMRASSRNFLYRVIKL